MGCGMKGVSGTSAGLVSIDGVFGALKDGAVGVGVGTPVGSAMVAVGEIIFSKTSGLPKSQRTPCLAQFPHRGWTSSHYSAMVSRWCFLHTFLVSCHLAASVPTITSPPRQQTHTLIFRFLHLRQPARDFLCDLRGGIAIASLGIRASRVVNYR